MKDFLKKYGLLIIPAYAVLDGLPSIIQGIILSITGRTERYLLNSTIFNLLVDFLMAFAIFLSFKAVSKPLKRSKNQLIGACFFAVESVIAEQLPYMMRGRLYISPITSPITVIAAICIIANAILQIKNIRQKKDAVAESNAENLKGKVLFDSVSVEDNNTDAVITVTDEGFRYVREALQGGTATNEFVEYSKIVEFKKILGVYNITGNGYTYIFKIDKSAQEAIAYIHQRFIQEQHKPHIMKCNICGQIFTYTLAEIDEQLKEMKSAAGSMVAATLTSLATSSLVGSVQSRNAQAAANSAKDKLDALTRCPNCRSTNATEITAEEAAEIRAASAAPVQAASSVDELKKFKELLDSGIITQEEFDAKKKQLLGL